MKNWQQLFMPQILDRGFSYYEDGAVEDLKVKDGTATAFVCGTEDYEVEISFGKETVTDMYCSCPYAESGAYCKHMAAVLFKLEDNWDTGSGSSSSGQDLGLGSHQEQRRDEISETVSQADDADVRKFLTEILQGDEKLFARFKSSVCHDISSADMARYKKQVDAVLGRYLGRENFISYREAHGFIREMQEFLGEDVRMMLDDGNYMEAFELTCYIFTETGNVDMDDSDGGLGMLAEQCADVWKEILDCADDRVQRSIYEWLTGHLDGSVIDYMEEYIENVLMDAFASREFMEEKLAFTQRKAEEKRDGSDSWSSVYQVQKWVLYHIGLMEDTGYEMESIMQYCKENWKYARVREYYIEKCLEQKNYGEAIAALEESIRMDAGSPGLVRSFSARLKEAYRMSGRTEDYKMQLWKLVTEDHAGDLDDFRELKKLYDEDEWKKVREGIFQALPSHAHLDCLYKEEGLYDRLLEYVLEAKGLYAAQQYQSVLQEIYPQQLLAKYEEELNEMAARTADRRRYQEWAAVLRRMLKISGGQEKVREIVADWRVRYKNRPAMMEEIRQLG